MSVLEIKFTDVYLMLGMERISAKLSNFGSIYVNGCVISPSTIKKIGLVIMTEDGEFL
jgi:hypothetical protein